jgi:hypothetical protein
MAVSFSGSLKVDGIFNAGSRNRRLNTFNKSLSLDMVQGQLDPPAFSHPLPVAQV